VRGDMRLLKPILPTATCVHPYFSDSNASIIEEFLFCLFRVHFTNHSYSSTGQNTSSRWESWAYPEA